MIPARQLSDALYGLWLLYRFDNRAWDFFGNTARDFWNAFIVAAVLAPLQISHVALQYNDGERSLAFAPYLVVQVLSYVLSWTLFPFVMLYMSRLLGRAPRYLAYIVPYIWMQLPMGLLLFSTQLLADLHLLPSALLEFLSPTVLVVFAVYGTFVAGIGLQITTGTAFGLVLLDYVLGLIVDNVISRI